jgi:hypothetical protein
MADLSEKRNERRYHCNAEFEWACFYKEIRSDCCKASPAVNLASGVKYFVDY